MNQEKIEKAINYTKASFSMEDMIISEEQEQKIYDVLSGKKTFEEVKSEIIEKYREN